MVDDHWAHVRWDWTCAEAVVGQVLALGGLVYFVECTGAMRGASSSNI